MAAGGIECRVEAGRRIPAEGRGGDGGEAKPDEDEDEDDGNEDGNEMGDATVERGDMTKRRSMVGVVLVPRRLRVVRRGDHCPGQSGGGLGGRWGGGEEP